MPAVSLHADRNQKAMEGPPDIEVQVDLHFLSADDFADTSRQSPHTHISKCVASKSQATRMGLDNESQDTVQ